MRHFNCIIVFVGLLFSLSCSTLKECNEIKLAESKSPDDNFVAAVFVRNCGATTPYVYHVNLRSSSSRFRENVNGTLTKGEVYRAARNNPEIRWQDSSTLLIHCGSCSEETSVRLEQS
jgi:hypothetical protein